MIGIRQKLILGFGGILAVVIAIGFLTMEQIDRLGMAIDVIMKENFRSVLACQDMKESLERMDSGILFTLAGNGSEGRILIDAYEPRFREALQSEFDTITLPGERELAEKIKNLFDRYMLEITQIADSSRSISDRQTDYFQKLQPLFSGIKETSQKVLLLNQMNMNEANENARRLATDARLRVIYAIIISSVMALLFSYLSQRWILNPINRLIESTNEIAQGNLDIVLHSKSDDEIGRLSKSFNDMTVALRHSRMQDRISLMRTRRATEEVFRALPTAIAVLDLSGKVEVATDTADDHFGLSPGVNVNDLGFDWLPALMQKALEGDRAIERDSRQGYIQMFIDNREYFFQPMLVPIPVDEEQRDPTGVALILKDVTQVQEQQELKRSAVSTVLHQLKTPLTSLRMSIHLLMEERFGVLSEKQTELMMTARSDSERLVAILDDLLDINRIESGRSNLQLKPISPSVLVRDAIEPFLIEAKDRGIQLTTSVSVSLPDVMADAGRMQHVFSNLLTNAIRFTSPGGSIEISAVQNNDRILFNIDDSGTGILPDHLSKIFDPFYRSPGQEEKSGAGLGLTIVREIINAHGGVVSVESCPGKGSSFRFTLPLNNTYSTGMSESI